MHPKRREEDGEMEGWPVKSLDSFMNNNGSDVSDLGY